MRKMGTNTIDRGENLQNGPVGFKKGVDPWRNAQQMLAQRDRKL
jgi:hypothetical protein